MSVTFRQLEGYMHDIDLAGVFHCEPPIRRKLVAKFKLGYVTIYVVYDDGVEVFSSDNWREALIEFNHGDVAGTMGDELQAGPPK